MSRALAIQAVALAAARIWAYLLAHPSKDKPTAAAGKIEIWRVEPGEVRSITVQEAQAKVVLEPREPFEDEKPYLWVRTETQRRRPRRKPKGPETPKDQPREAPADPPDTEAKTETAEFKGNRQAERALAALATLSAQRRVGALAELDGADFGFPSDNAYISIERTGGGEPLRIELGSVTFGNAGRYVHFPRDGAVYLVKSALTQNLKRPARRLVDREMFPYRAGTAERVELRMGSKVASFWRLIDTDSQSGEWATSPGAENPDEAVQEWIRDLAKLKVDGYVSGGESDQEATGEEATGEAALEVRLFREDRPALSLHFLRESDGAWIAKSTYTRAPVKVNGALAASLIEKGRSLLRDR